jgi:cysteine synthase
VLHAYGVETVHCDRCRDMAEAMGLAERMAERNGWHPVGQFTSEGNPLVHYQTTGAEILEDLPRVDVFIAGIGTGGTIMGVGRRLKEADPSTRLVGVEPRLGDRLQGLRPLSDGFRPPLLDLGLLDGRRMVGNPEALAAAKRIMEVEGISAGVSAGAAYVAARREAERLEQGNIVMLFADGAEKYLPARPWEAALAGEGRLDDLHLW